MKNHAWCLYLSHALSMLLSRAYEFAAIIFIQHAFPGTLLPISINGITETLCVLLFSSSIGRWVDAQSRLRTIITAIVVNRVMVIMCCVVWTLLLNSHDPSHMRYYFVLLLALGMVERSSRSANILSMERNWIPTIASSGANDTYSLTHLNTMMRRIDVICKFLAPLSISTLIAAVSPLTIAVAVTGIIAAMSVLIECWCIQVVWKGNEQIRASKAPPKVGNAPPRQPQGIQDPISVTVCAVTAITTSIRSHAESVRFFFNTPVWIPSLCAAANHGSVLTFSGTLITYLLNAGFPVGVITLGKAVSQLFEIGSTFVFPRLVRIFSNPSSSNLPQQEAIPRTDAEDALLNISEVVDEARDNSGGIDIKDGSVDKGVVKAGLSIVFMVPSLVRHASAQNRLVSDFSRFQCFSPSSTLTPTTHRIRPIHQSLRLQVLLTSTFYLSLSSSPSLASPCLAVGPMTL